MNCFKRYEFLYKLWILGNILLKMNFVEEIAEYFLRKK